jgi:hypothetical protein
MRDRVRSLGPWLLGAVAIVSLGVVCAGCGAKGTGYLGTWECAAGGKGSFEVKANNGAFLVTINGATTYPAALDDKGTLVISGVPSLGSLPLPIDAASDELICSACECHRLTKKRTADAGVRVARAAAAYFRPRANDAGDSGAQRRTVADIRNVGTAMFSWVTDQVGAAAAGQKAVDLAKFPPVSSFAALKELLVPKYIQALPERDGWGNPFEYRLRLKDPTAGVYVMSVRSPGRDGKFSGLTYAVEAFPRADYDRDIVWADGYFVQWPQ